MKSGLEFFGSAEQELLNIPVEIALRGVYAQGVRKLNRSLPPELRRRDPILWQKRIGGPNGGLFEMAKIETLDANGKPINDTAAEMRVEIDDEAAQHLNMRRRHGRRREMVAVSWRAVMPESNDLGAVGKDEIMDVAGKQGKVWEKMTFDFPPGVASPYAEPEHTNIHLSREELIMLRVYMEPDFCYGATLQSSIAVMSRLVTARQNGLMH